MTTRYENQLVGQRQLQVARLLLTAPVLTLIAITKWPFFSLRLFIKATINGIIFFNKSKDYK